MIIGKFLTKKGIEASKRAAKGLSRAFASRKKDETIASPVNERTELPDAGVAPKMTVKVIRVNKAPKQTRQSGRGRTYTRTIIE
jgi:hypothetical protein